MYIEPENKASYSPWGAPDTVYVIADGILDVSTPSHGGILLSYERNQQIPESCRSIDGAYEEGCRWAIPFVIFKDEFCARYRDRQDYYEETHKQAIQTLINYEPDAYATIFGTMPTAEESHKVRDREFTERNKNNFIVYSAFGAGYKDVHGGFVGVRAVKPATGEERYFFVPESRYSIPYVVDLDKDQPWDFKKPY